VSSDPGIWSWTRDFGRLGFTVTFSLGRTPEEVLSLYGADPGRAELLSRDGAWIRYPPNIGGAQLRAGTLGRWGFCFEEAGFEGFKARTLSALSADTETISFFTSPEASNFIYLKDSEGIEAFEPGRPETLRGDGPCKFWAETQKIMDRSSQTAPIHPTNAVMQVITKHIRDPLDRATLVGPLLTSFLSDANRAPMGAEFDEAPSAPEPTMATTAPPAAEPARPFPASWDTGPIPVVTAPTVSYDPVYSRFSREAQAS
jgi:hypothetical protein